MTINAPKEKLYVIYDEKGEKVLNTKFIKKKFKGFLKFDIILSCIVILIFSLGAKNFLSGLFAGIYAFGPLLFWQCMWIAHHVFWQFVTGNKKNTPNM